MKSKLLIFSVSVAVIIVALSVAYYFVIFLPKQSEIKKQQDVLNTQETQEDVKETETRLDIYKICEEEARAKAIDKLKKLIEIGALSKEAESEAKKAIEVGLARKEDIEDFLAFCLEAHGVK